MQRHTAPPKRAVLEDKRMTYKRMTYDLRGGRVYREEVSARVFSRHVEFMQTVIRYSTLHLVKDGVDAYTEVYGRRCVSARNRRQYSSAVVLKTAHYRAKVMRGLHAWAPRTKYRILVTRSQLYAAVWLWSRAGIERNSRILRAQTSELYSCI